VPVWTYSTGTTLFETDGPETHLKAFLDAYSDAFERLCSILAIPALKASLLAADDICTTYASLEDHVVEPHTEYGAWQDRHLDQLKRSVAILEAASGDEAAGIFIACPKCRSNAVDTEQKQTRSADEPMTIFITCLNCGKKWRQ
jgi:transcription elongation factor S-II